jgi:hypothetical protein
MTATGHTLIGITIGMLFLRRNTPALRTGITLACLGLLANFPDFPFAGWGHDDYRVSHSVFSNLAIMIVCLSILYAWSRARTFLGGGRILLATGLACLSHLVLDATYNHGLGVDIAWPFGSWRLALPIPWLETVKESLPAMSWHTAKVIALELLTYGSVLVLVVVGKRVRGR